MQRVAVIPGSIRSVSLNRRLGADLVERLQAAGVDAELVDLADHPMAIYHGDDEASQGAPPEAVALHDRLAAVDGLIVLSPEYNGAPPALLKNAIDWVTRVDRAVFRRLLVGLGCTSPGPRGGRSVLASMHAMFTHMRLEIHDATLSVPHSGEAFADAEAYRLARPDAVAAADEFVTSYVEALTAWVDSGRDAA